MKNLSIKIPFGNNYFPLILRKSVKKIFIFEGYAFCVHKSFRLSERSGYKYTVCSMESGRKIITAKSAGMAIFLGKKFLSNKYAKNPDYFHFVMRSQVSLNKLHLTNHPPLPESLSFNPVF